MNSLRAGRAVEFNGVTFSSLSELYNHLNSGDAVNVALAEKFLFGAHQQWNAETRQMVSELGTDKDPNVKLIRASFGLPGSSVREEEEALYNYRVAANRFQNMWEDDYRRQK